MRKSHTTMSSCRPRGAVMIQDMPECSLDASATNAGISQGTTVKIYFLLQVYQQDNEQTMCTEHTCSQCRPGERKNGLMITRLALFCMHSLNASLIDGLANSQFFKQISSAISYATIENSRELTNEHTLTLRKYTFFSIYLIRA